MSNGLNRAFRAKMRGEKFRRSNVEGGRDPLDYLRNNLFEPVPHVSLLGKAPGRYRFNLVKNGNFISVRLAASDRSRSSNTFRAYWCPDVLRASTKLVLGDQANYFFCPALTGSILQINGETVTLHNNKVTPFPPANLAILPRGGKAGNRKWDKGVFTTSIIIGMRNPTGIWEFYQQSFNRSPVVPLPPIQVTQI
ncbi:MAG: hypothetical protein OEZ39_15735 [Gammaproteobacteria bacterium]|nr:hypothetical protein [Gammaproteobacteria bacterium]MDH5653308.1 hypothetical protein [Gammaproteobacteria bacterium]